MNTKILELLFKIIDADINRETKEKILCHYLLPRDEPTLSPLIMAEDVGPVQAKTAQELEKTKSEREAEEEMRETFKKMGL